jgi:hypothetical protein
MTEMLRIFVGATNDLEAERAVIGRSVAELPVKIGIEIRRTPQLPTWDEIAQRLHDVDRVYFLMGNDITAPAGLEWLLAWRMERSVLPLRRSPHPTPAASEFFRLAPTPWHNFRTQADLAKLVSLDLARMLHQPDNRFGLSVTDMERVAFYLRGLEKKTLAPVREPQGAEGSAILIDTAHRAPEQ